ncbi:MAG: hypothetical protein DYG89_36855 [Caldilinea sp. CFX5]|nr:hypothetical protein [Caldilinea sp. CFX5]
MATTELPHQEQNQAISLLEDSGLQTGEAYSDKAGVTAELSDIDVWARMAASLHRVSADFMAARNQLAQQNRETLFP